MIYNNYEKTLGNISLCKDDELFDAIREYNEETLYYRSDKPITLNDMTVLYGSRLSLISVSNRNGLYRNDGMFSICRTSYINNSGEISFWGYYDKRAK